MVEADRTLLMFNEIRAALAFITARMDREFSELTDRVRRIDERLDGLVAQVTRLNAQVTEGFKR